MDFVAVASDAVLSPPSDAKVTNIAIFGKNRMADRSVSEAISLT